MVVIGTQTVHFGTRGQLDYTKTHDVNAKQAYIAKHPGLSNATNKQILTNPLFWERWILWNKPSKRESIRYLEHKLHIRIRPLPVRLSRHRQVVVGGATSRRSRRNTQKTAAAVITAAALATALAIKHNQKHALVRAQVVEAEAPPAPAAPQLLVASTAAPPVEAVAPKAQAPLLVEAEASPPPPVVEEEEGAFVSPEEPKLPQFNWQQLYNGLSSPLTGNEILLRTQADTNVLFSGKLHYAKKDKEDNLNLTCFVNIKNHIIDLTTLTIVRLSCEAIYENNIISHSGNPIASGDYGEIWDVLGKYVNKIIIKEQKSCYAFINEINCLQQLQSTGIVPILYDAYICNLGVRQLCSTPRGLIRYRHAMEKLDETLESFLKGEQSDTEYIEAVGTQIAKCLKILDNNKILHRDFNYGNIMLKNPTTNKLIPDVRIIDFGNAYNKQYPESVQMITNMFDEKSQLLFYENNPEYATNYIWFKDSSEKHIKNLDDDVELQLKYKSLLMVVTRKVSGRGFSS